MIPAPPLADWKQPTPHNGQRLLEWQAKRLVNMPRPVFRVWPRKQS
jgi:hypothetical protein